MSPQLQTIKANILALLPDSILRNRIPQTGSLKAYQELNEICKALEKDDSIGEELRKIQQIRIVALMGLWNFSREESFFSEARALSESILKNGLKNRHNLPALFCLAQSDLRVGNKTRKSILESFVGQKDRDPSPDVLAAASVLALYGNDIDLHEHYRKLFLQSKSLEPNSVLSFLKSRHHRLYLLKGDISTTHTDRYDRYRERLYVINNQAKPSFQPFPKSVFKDLNDKDAMLPGDSQNKLTLLMFLETPSQDNILLNPRIYFVPTLEEVEDAKRREAERLAEKDKKKRKKSKRIPIPQTSGVLRTLFELGDMHINNELRVVLVFLGGDLQQIKKITERHRIKAEVLYTPEGLSHPIVKTLGLSATDHFPNTFLLNRSGAFSWHITGMPYRVESTNLLRATELSLRNHLFTYELEAGYQALKAQNYQRAEQLFTGPYVSEGRVDQMDNWRQSGGKTEFHKWTPSQHHGLAKARIGLGKWNEALKAIEKAKAEHMVYFRQDEKKPSLSGISLHRTHAIILEQLGRKTEARSMRNKANLPPTQYHTTSVKKYGGDEAYEAFGDRLQKLEISPGIK